MATGHMNGTMSDILRWVAMVVVFLAMGFAISESVFFLLRRWRS